MLFRNSVRTWKRTSHLTITKINWLMLFKEILFLHRELYEIHKYKMQRYWLPKQVVPLGLKGLSYTATSMLSCSQICLLNRRSCDLIVGLHYISETLGHVAVACLEHFTFEITILLFWIRTPCALGGRYQQLGDTYFLHLQGSKMMMVF
jgi:hypothetical protein